MKIKSILCCALGVLSVSWSWAQSQTKTHIYQSGQGDYACYRIPSIVRSNDGTVLAFAEGRKSGCSDTGNIDLLVRRSVDGGKTWGPQILVWDDGDNVCGNPSAVVDKVSGRIFLISTWNLGTDHESQIIKGTSKDTRHVFYLYSDDDGLTWSKPTDITATTKKPEWMWYATGPVHGIQMQNSKYKNRIVMAANYSLKQDGSMKSIPYYSHVIYSDDLGKNWHLGGQTALGGNECTVVELKNGDLMLNMRNYNREKGKCRSYVISSDGGQTWGEMKYATDLIEPVCQGAILNLTNKRGKLSETLVFSNPASETLRNQMTVKVSSNNGASFDRSIPVYQSHAAYSDMVVLKDNSIGLLYENGDKNAYERITFEIVDL